MNAILEYFQRVVTLSPDTYFSVHYKTPTGIPGVAFQDFAAAEKAALRWVGQGRDVYLAMGVQQTCEPNGLARRWKRNTISTRCLYMDIDVKPTAYATTQEAVAAIRSFTAWVGLPQPTALVYSGTGGFHVYWTLSEVITPEEHSKLSHQLSLAAREFGLKFDAKCTTDLVHLFRVPDTKNFKHDPPKPVKLVHAGDEVPVDVIRQVLARFVVATPKSNPKQNLGNDDLKAGTGYTHPTIDQVAEVCPFIKETLDGGGVNLVDDPQWHAMAALSCHCVDPSATIHRLCSKSAYYKYDDTEKKLAQAQSYRDQNPQLGPPKCITLQSGGAPHCATCPHLALGTSPIALPFKQAGQINGYTILDDLPQGYFRNNDNWICLEESESDEAKADRVIVFPYAIDPTSGYLEGTRRLTFMTWQGEEKTQKTFETTVFSDDVSFKKAMLAEAMPMSINVGKGRSFFVEYIRLLQSKRDTMVRVAALGWTMQSGVMGFAYDGEFVTPQGKFPCQRPPKAIADYKAIGTDAIWRDISKLVLTPDRPDLMVLVATAFAAPLVKMCGQNGYMIGAWSSASGIGKTTALLLSQTVWGYPALGGFTDTVNYTFSKCANIQHLPVIYDEVKGDQSADIVRLALGMTAGREKGRSDRSGQMRETRTWHTNIPYATNSSIVSAIADQTTGTAASVYRVFEFQALNLPNANQSFATNMAHLIIKLSENYGCIGKIYANYLGQNYEKIRDQLDKFQIKLAGDLFAQQAERFWIAAMSTTLLGASLASALGLASFDIKLMKQFMIREFQRMRNDQRLSIGDYTNVSAVYNELSVFMAENWKNVVITDKAWTAPGRPPKGYAKVLKAPLETMEVGAQIYGDPHTIQIREAFLSKWCISTKRQKHALVEALKKVTGATQKVGRLGSGAQIAKQDERIIVIPVTGTPLETMCEYAIQYKDLKP